MGIRFYPLRVLRVEPNTPYAKNFYFEIPPELKETFRYRPGQYLTFRFSLDGKEYRRSYSFMTSPYTDSVPGVTIKRIPGGVISNYTNDHAGEGDVWEAYPPMGNFVLDPDPQRAGQYMMIGAGSGITPLMSMIKSVLHVESRSRVWLLYGNRNEDSILFRQVLQELEEAYAPRFRVIHSLSRPSAEWKGRVGRLNEAAIEAIIREEDIPVSASECYLCGPSGMIAAGEVALARLGVDKSRIHKELFTAPPVLEEPEPEGEGDSASFSVAEVTIILDERTHHLRVRPDEYILDAALEEGLEPPYACRMGICTTCRARLLEGEVHMDEDEGLSDQDIEAGFILTCQAKPLTPVVKLRYE